MNIFNESVMLSVPGALYWVRRSFRSETQSSGSHSLVTALSLCFWPWLQESSHLDKPVNNETAWCQAICLSRDCRVDPGLHKTTPTSLTHHGLPLNTVWWLTPPSVQRRPSKSVVTGSSLKSRQPSTHLFPLISKIPNLEKDVPLSHHLKNKLPSPKLISQMLMSPFLIKSNDLGIFFFLFIRFWHLWIVQEIILWL